MKRLYLLAVYLLSAVPGARAKCKGVPVPVDARQIGLLGPATGKQGAVGHERRHRLFAYAWCLYARDRSTDTCPLSSSCPAPLPSFLLVPRGLPIGGDIGCGQRRPGKHHIKERRRNPAAERAEPSTAHQRNAPEVPTSSPPAGRALRRAYAARDSIFWSGIVRRAPSTRSCPLLHKVT